MSLQEIWQRIEFRYGAFSPQLRRAARFVRENPQEIALHSLRGVAGQAGVSPTSMSRLLHALEFESWESFQADHRTWLTAGSAKTFSDRANRLISETRSPGAEDVLLDNIRVAEGANLRYAFDPHARPNLKLAADMLGRASGIAIAGIRSCYPVAYSLHYTLSLFRPETRLMGSVGGGLLDDLHQLGKDDVLVVISVAPYSRESVELTKLAKQDGVSVVGITDGPLTPIARSADIVLVATNDSPAHIPSPIGLIAVAQALASLVLARAGDGALMALRRREAALETISAYLPEETQR
ncbi:MurR/RpiR family transcriptional regulator [Mesorhizobium sp. CAU 1741]|uniref:MurR/RpiR family transcriptional regulator n=1 Tax=Mesorhizobium sp. CAU 1741 TaxID=3140366 RepID=UPI00325B60C9